MNLLDLVVKITCDDQASNKVDGIGSKIKDGLGNAAKVAGAAVTGAIATATAAVVAITKQATDAYANYEQLVGGVQKLFGDSANTVIANAEQAYKTAGLSANDYMETVTSFSASLLQSLGNDTQEAAKYADQAVQDMADNANTFGTSIEDIQNAYQGFAKQNYTMLDNLKLGYGGTKEEMERLIEDANRVKEANGEMADLSIDSFADITEAIHIIQNEMGITGTTAKEAAQTIEGSVNSAKAAYQNWLVALGDENADLSGKTQELVDSIVTAASNLLPRIVEILGSLGESINEFLPQILTLVTEFAQQLIETAVPVIMDLAMALLEALPELLEVIMQIITSIGEYLAENLPTLIETVVSTITDLIQTFTEHLPELIELGVQIIVALGQGIIESIPTLIEAIPQIIDALVEAIIGGVGAIIDAGVKLLTALIENLDEIISAIVDALPGIIQALVKFFGAAIPDIVQAGVDLLVALVDNLPDIIEAIVDALPEIIDAIVDGFLGSIDQIIDVGVELFVALVENMPEIISKIVEKIPELITRIIGAITDAIPRMVDAGFQLLTGLATGIANAVGSVIQSAINAVGGVVDAVKGFFGIASPSKVFMGIGDYVMQGLEKGIEDNADLPMNAMEEAIENVTKAATIDTEVNLNASPSEASKSFVFNVEVNNTGQAVDAGRTIGEALYTEYARLERSALYA